MIASQRIRRLTRLHPGFFAESLFKAELLSIRQNNAMTCRPSGWGRMTPFRAHPNLVGQRLHLEDALVADGEVPGETLSLSSSDTWPRITKASIRVLFQFLLLPSLKRECERRK